MMLTHSQVSVVLSSGVVIMFTGALFMSGYVLQQRTLNKLRTAVIQQMQPRPSPKIYLPDKFKKQNALQFDDNGFLADNIEGGAGDHDASGSSSSSSSDDADAIYVEIRPTEPDAKDQPPPQQQQDQQASSPVEDGPVKEIDPDVVEKPMSSAERRKKIKDEIRRLAQSGEPVYYQRRLW
ncbi:hypothetical protein Micbo1qcDRAFT_158802 [Microdochium bolleyi]|uniref:Uncharacterized protein n=1 Tax=Microdochium bolleyi TaxID=196109 RepID=A0A136J9P4_9PEZI|nr:hypothetical protein Micbo1qcDRAFT_158802 [Microdochium bolleyi]